MIRLETRRLILRDYLPEDKEDYILLKSDPKTMYYLQDIQLHSRQEGERDFSEVLADAASSERRFLFHRGTAWKRGLYGGKPNAPGKAGERGILLFSKILGAGIRLGSVPAGAGICFFGGPCVPGDHRVPEGKPRL